MSSMRVAISHLNVNIDLAEITPLHFCCEPFCRLISSKGQTQSLMVETWGPLCDPRWHQRRWHQLDLPTDAFEGPRGSI